LKSTFKVTLKNEYHDFFISLGSVKTFTKEKMSVKNEEIEIPAHSFHDIEIGFFPSSIASARTCEIEVYSECYGKALYLLTGDGDFPGQMDKKTVVSELDDTNTSFISFLNPFRDPISVSITLDCPEDLNEFSLVGFKKSRLNIGSMEKFDIPFSFHPKHMMQSDAKIIVELNSKLVWIYPIEGIPEVSSSSKPVVIEVRTRETLRQKVEIMLSGCNIEFNALGSPNDAFEALIECTEVDNIEAIAQAEILGVFERDDLLYMSLNVRPINLIF